MAEKPKAGKNDHRVIGKELDLFSFQNKAGAGLPLIHPKGAIIRDIIEDFWKQEHRKRGYELVWTPHIFKLDLFKTSGHYGNYKKFMFLTEVDKTKYAIKPMNCPGTILIYKDTNHSYKELPLRYAELGTCYRNELSGVLGGLFRVRSLTIDDAHIFCTPEQAEQEVKGVANLIIDFYKVFGFKDVKTELSTMPKKHIGTPAMWKKSEAILEKALKSNKLKYKINKGEGAFYGPKIDFHVKDNQGRNWQLGTIQLDFNMPDRFKLRYVGEDNKPHKPVCIHRAVMGSFERFFGILIEHYNGAFPLWLSPVQVKVITFTDRNEKYAQKVAKQFTDAGLRIELDDRTESVQKKVREAELQKIPYIIVCGDKEQKAKTIAVRQRSVKKIKYKVKPKTFIKQLKKQIEAKK
ncbi:threonine--tRNA ligase [Candidatus Woesearchaeota archaeon]|nr:threonine--tRNA ligase [Candidatus Woesearchaeota archaeon]